MKVWRALGVAGVIAAAVGGMGPFSGIFPVG